MTGQRMWSVIVSKRTQEGQAVGQGMWTMDNCGQSVAVVSLDIATLRQWSVWILPL